MTIFIDMDGVLCQFVEGVLELWKDFDCFRVPRYEEIWKWRLESNLPEADRKVARKFLDRHLAASKFWADLQPHDGAIEGIRRIALKHNVYIATTPWNSDGGLVGKREWLRRNLPEFHYERTIFIQDKSLLRGNVLVDDKPINVASFVGSGILFHRPWNRDYHTDYPVRAVPYVRNGVATWPQLVKLLE